MTLRVCVVGCGSNDAVGNSNVTIRGVAPTATISSAIGTVGIVTFTTDLSNPASAHIDFGLKTSYGLQAPVDLSATNYRTLLLGMKQSKNHHYRVIVENASGQCTGSDSSLTTKTSGASTGVGVACVKATEKSRKFNRELSNH
jgi:hypothetical protein